jgi:ASC-1-like (ASCH) protein
MTHELKCWPEFFKEVKEGRKKFEFRINDRNYKVGDYLILKEWDNKKQCYTGEICSRYVSYIFKLETLIITDDVYVIMSLY